MTRVGQVCTHIMKHYEEKALLRNPIMVKDRIAKSEVIVIVKWVLLAQSQGQGSKLLGFQMSGTPKNGDGNPIFGPGFPTGNPAIVRLTDSLKLTGNTEIAGEIQILRRVF